MLFWHHFLLLGKPFPFAAGYSTYYISGIYYFCSNTVHFIVWWQKDFKVSSLVMVAFKSTAW